MNLDDAIDFVINNHAPNKDAVTMLFGNNPDSAIEVVVERENEKVYVSVTDHFDGTQRRYVLGEPGFTEKL